MLLNNGMRTTKWLIFITTPLPNDICGLIHQYVWDPFILNERRQDDYCYDFTFPDEKTWAAVKKHIQMDRVLLNALVGRVGVAMV